MTKQSRATVKRIIDSLHRLPIPCLDCSATTVRYGGWSGSRGIPGCVDVEATFRCPMCGYQRNVVRRSQHWTNDELDEIVGLLNEYA